MSNHLLQNSNNIGANEQQVGAVANNRCISCLF